MTEPSQYFKGRTVQEQMDEVIGYVDKRAAEVAAAKADAVLQPAENAKTAAQVAAQEAEAAKNATIAALPDIHQDISDLKAENVAPDGRLNTVELKVQTAEGNIVTIQGQIVALQTADGQNVKINNINQYAVGLTGNQNKTGVLGFFNAPKDASMYTKINTAGDWIIGKIPAPTQTIVINAIVAARDFTGIQLWTISILTDGQITVTDQLGGTPPTIKHMVKDNKHYLAITVPGNNFHYSIKWFMCRMGGTLTYMETTDLPIQADSSYTDVNA